MSLDAERVRELYIDCLWKKGESHDCLRWYDHVSLHTQRLRDHTPEIRKLLGQFPDSFRGGLWGAKGTLEDVCRTCKLDEEHAKQLIFLGRAIGEVILAATGGNRYRYSLREW